MHEGTKSIITRGGVGGLLIDGKYYAIRCWSDHWTFGELGEGKPEPMRRYDSAEVQTENFGVIKIWPKKLGQSELSKLARGVQKFLENDPSDEIQVIWG